MCSSTASVALGSCVGAKAEAVQRSWAWVCLAEGFWGESGVGFEIGTSRFLRGCGCAGGSERVYFVMNIMFLYCLCVSGVC